MTARQKKKSGNNSDVKATLIILLTVAIAGAGFWFLHGAKKKNNEEVHPSKQIEAPVVVKPIVAPKPILSPVTQPIKPLIRKSDLNPVKGLNVTGAKIAFVIDDWGYSLHNCAVLREIPDPIAVSILPNLKHSIDVVKCAQVADKTVMLHLPMQPYYNHDPYPDNYILTTTMSPTEVELILEAILKKMPQVEGVNNHMGSKAMEDKKLLKLVFRHLKAHGKFFVDSMTSPNHSYGHEVAEEYGLPFGQRDVFLDNVNTRSAILKQFNELKLKATRKGYAVAIGHDRVLTMQLIKEQAPLLKAQGFKIVSVKELLRNK